MYPVPLQVTFQLVYNIVDKQEMKFLVGGHKELIKVTMNVKFKIRIVASS